MSLGDVMREASSRIGRRVTQLELSKVCGVSQGHLSNMVLGRQRGSEELLQKIAEYLSSIDGGKEYSVSDIEADASAKQIVTPMAAQPNGTIKPVKLGNDFVTLPEVLSIPAEGFEAITTAQVMDWHLVPKYLAGSATIIVKAEGDSMSPSILANDLLLVEEATALTVTDGDVVIADIDGELSCKKVKLRGEGAITLLPDNPVHNPIFINGDDGVRIVGRVVGLHRKLQS